MPDDNYVYDEIRLNLQGRRKNRTLQAGQRLEIRRYEEEVKPKKLHLLRRRKVRLRERKNFLAQRPYLSLFVLPRSLSKT